MINKTQRNLLLLSGTTIALVILKGIFWRYRLCSGKYNRYSECNSTTCEVIRGIFPRTTNPFHQWLYLDLPYEIAVLHRDKHSIFYGRERIDNDLTTVQIVNTHHGDVFQLRENGEILRWLGAPCQDECNSWERLDKNPDIVTIGICNNRLIKQYSNSQKWEWLSHQDWRPLE